MTISDMALSIGGRGTAGRHAGAPRKEEHTQMKIKALANYCKQTKSVVLLDQYDESGVLQRQYVQAGSAVFPLDGLPLLNEDTLIAILDIPADERCDWVVQRTNAQCALSYVQDNEENDQLSELAGITFSANGYDLQPVYTPYGLVTIDSSTRRVIADSRKTAQYFARLINGNVTIIVKNGFMLIAAIVPVIRWADEKAVQFMRDAAGYAAVAFQRRQSQGADLGENEE